MIRLKNGTAAMMFFVRNTKGEAIDGWVAWAEAKYAKEHKYNTQIDIPGQDSMTGYPFTVFFEPDDFEPDDFEDVTPRIPIHGDSLMQEPVGATS